MKTWISLIAILTTTTTFAATVRTLDGQQITNGSAVLTLPVASDTIVGRASTDTLTNKSLTAPVISSPTGIVKGDVGLSNVDNTSDVSKNSATVTLTNKTLTAPVINSPTGIVKGDVGLSNVDNTSDATKNSATATLTNKTIDYSLNTILNLPSSSPTVSGSQAAPGSVTAAGGVSFSGSNYFNTKYIQGSGGAVVVTASPQIAAGSLVGQSLKILCTSAVNTVTFADGTGLSLNGAFVCGSNSAIVLDWNGSVWTEIARR